MSGVSIPKHLRSWKVVSAIILSSCLLNGFVFHFAVTHWASIGVSRGSSMAPSGNDGEISLVFKFYDSFWDPDRGEEVGVVDGLGSGQKWGKRVIGLPGDTIVLDGTRVMIDDVELVEPWLKYPWTQEDYDEWQLGPGEYYVMGDNRDASFDSRQIGPVTREQLKPMLPLVPISKAGPLGVGGFLVLVALFPGVPLASGIAAGKIARKRNRSHFWFTAGALLQGVGLAAILLLPPKDAQPTAKAQPAPGTNNIRALCFVAAVIGWGFAGQSIGALFRNEIGVALALVVPILYVTLNQLTVAKRLPVSFINNANNALWMIISFSAARFVASSVFSDPATGVLFGMIAGFGPYAFSLLIRFPPPNKATDNLGMWAEWFAGQLTWWAIAAMVLHPAGAVLYMFIPAVMLVAIVLAARVNRARDWAFETTTAVLLCAPLGLGAEERIGSAAAGWLLSTLAATWLVMSVWKYRNPLSATEPEFIAT